MFADYLNKEQRGTHGLQNVKLPMVTIRTKRPLALS